MKQLYLIAAALLLLTACKKESIIDQQAELCGRLAYSQTDSTFTLHNTQGDALRLHGYLRLTSGDSLYRKQVDGHQIQGNASLTYGRSSIVTYSSTPIPPAVTIQVSVDLYNDVNGEPNVAFECAPQPL